MIKLAGMAFEVCFDLAQTSCTGQLAVQHRDQVRPGLQAARVRLGTVLRHKPVENHPWNVFQKPVKNDILMLHSVAPCSYPVDSQTPGIE